MTSDKLGSKDGEFGASYIRHADTVDSRILITQNTCLSQKKLTNSILYALNVLPS